MGELEDLFGEKIFVIEKPAQDFARLKAAIEKSGAEYVVGIGMVKSESRWEKLCYNRIGRNVINPEFAEKLSLASLGSKIPAFAGMTEGVAGIPTGEGMSFGFCNYVAFRIRTEMGTKLKRGFLHLNVGDLN